MVVPAMSRPDTIYLSCNIPYYEDVLQTMNHIKFLLIDSKCTALTRFRRRMQAADEETARKMRDMTVTEAEAYMQENEEGLESIEFDKVTASLMGYDFCCYGWSPRRGCSMTWENEKFKIHIIPKNVSKSPNFYLELGQVALWTHDWRELLMEAQEFINSLGLQPDIKLSRVDLATHTQLMTSEHLEYSIYRTRSTVSNKTAKHALKADIIDALTHATITNDEDERNELLAQVACGVDAVFNDSDLQDRVQWYNNFKTQQITFGKRGSRNPYARLYVKSREVAYSPLKKRVFHNVWSQAGWDLDRDVINVEFELNRDYFRGKFFEIVNGNKVKYFQMNTVEDLLKHFEDMLRYLMGPNGFLQMVIPSETDSNRARWAVNPIWHEMIKGLDKVAKVKIHYFHSPAEHDEKMQKTALAYTLNYFVAKCESEGRVIELTDEFMDEMETKLTEQAIDEISKLAMSVQYKKYIRNKLKTEAARRGLTQKPDVVQVDYFDYFSEW